MKYKKKVCVYPFIPSSLASHKVVIVGVIASPKLRRDQYKDKDFLKKPIMITYLGCTDFDQIWHGDQVEAGQAFYWVSGDWKVCKQLHRQWHLFGF